MSAGKTACETSFSKAFVENLKTIYRAPTREAGESALQVLGERWGKHYAVAVRSWEANWNDLATMQNPVCNGEYVANRVYTAEIQKPTKADYPCGRSKKYRPEEEVIRVPVLAIVDADTWQRANDMLQKNRRMARRNAKHDYLLNGLLRWC